VNVSRRRFLHLGLLGAGGLALAGLEVFSRKPPTGGFLGGPTTGPSLGELLSARKQAGDVNKLDVFLAGEDYVASTDNYVAFFLQRSGGDRLFGANTRVWLTPTADTGSRLVPAGPISAPWYPYASPEGPPPLPQGLNAFSFTFDRPGIWTMVVETSSGTHLLGTTIIQGLGRGVSPAGHAETKVPGEKAIPSQTPTVDNPRGVNPICTRRPACDMHQITLAQAIQSGKPTAFIVSTPEFCQSRNCGPSLNELIAVENDLRSKVNFVHAEVYPNEQTTTVEQKITSPTFKEWNLGSEPWLFLIDRNGIITQRFEGGFTAGQIRAALQPLVGA
jgi:hypothetical protein